MVQRNASLQIGDRAAGFCEAVVYVRRRMSPPARLSVAQISKELGIHITTRLWFTDFVG